MPQLSFDIIGTVHTPYKEKFAVPRQPGLVVEAEGQIELLPPFNHKDAVRGLEQFSHLWLLFVFHQTLPKAQEQGWKPLVRPPRLGGNDRVGVFATRSTFRPNPIGMSVVKLDSVEEVKNGVRINISGMDLVDQTPLIDIKPYIPYSDSLPNAEAGFANSSPDKNMSVEFSPQAQSRLNELRSEYPKLEQLIFEVLKQDPRPAYKSRNSETQTYGVRLHRFNVTWEVSGNCSLVLGIEG